MTETPAATQDDLKDQLAKLESEVVRSRREIVTLTQIVLDARSAPSAPAVVYKDRVREIPLDDDTRRAMFEVMGMSVHLTRIPFLMRFEFMRKRHQRRLASALMARKLIAPKWYSETYPEVAKSGMEPALYFAAKGIEAGHVPHPKFRLEASK